jgi:hypothetical protein
MTTGRGKQPAKRFTPNDIRAIADSLQPAMDNLHAAAEMLESNGIESAYLHLTNLQNTLAAAVVRFAREAKGDAEDEVLAKLSGTISPREKSILRYQREKTAISKAINATAKASSNTTADVKKKRGT